MQAFCGRLNMRSLGSRPEVEATGSLFYFQKGLVQLYVTNLFVKGPRADKELCFSVIPCREEFPDATQGIPVRGDQNSPT